MTHQKKLILKKRLCYFSNNCLNNKPIYRTIQYTPCKAELGTIIIEYIRNSYMYMYLCNNRFIFNIKVIAVWGPGQEILNKDTTITPFICCLRMCPLDLSKNCTCVSFMGRYTISCIMITCSGTIRNNHSTARYKRFYIFYTCNLSLLQKINLYI